MNICSMDWQLKLTEPQPTYSEVVARVKVFEAEEADIRKRIAAQIARIKVLEAEVAEIKKKLAARGMPLASGSGEFTE